MQNSNKISNMSVIEVQKEVMRNHSHINNNPTESWGLANMQ